MALVHRAIKQADHNARSEFEQRFGQTMRGWLHRHPLWETACQYGSEEYYLHLAFEQFRQSATRQLVACRTLTEALTCLRVSLHAVLLETLRAYKRPEAVPASVEDLLPTATSQEFWERLQRVLPDDREQRLASLLYHCGLRPAEIARLYPQEWSDVQDVMLYWLLGTSVQEKTDFACPITLIPGHGTRLRDKGNLFFSQSERGKLKEASTTDTFCSKHCGKPSGCRARGLLSKASEPTTMVPWHNLTLSCMVVSDGSALRHLSVVMVQSGQDRKSNHLCGFVRSRTR